MLYIINMQCTRTSLIQSHFYFKYALLATCYHLEFFEPRCTNNGDYASNTCIITGSLQVLHPLKVNCSFELWFDSNSDRDFSAETGYDCCTLKISCYKFLDNIYIYSIPNTQNYVQRLILPYWIIYQWIIIQNTRFPLSLKCSNSNGPI